MDTQWWGQRSAWPVTREQLVLAITLLAGGVLFDITAAPVPWLPYLLGSAGLAALHERLRQLVDHVSALLAVMLTFGATSLFWAMTHPQGLPDVAAFALVAVGLFLQGRFARASTDAAIWIAIAVLPLAMHAAFTPRGPEVRAWEYALFSSSTGLLSLTPVAYVALAGTIARLRRATARTVITLTIVLGWVAVAAIAPVEGPGGRFGHGLTGALALLSPGLADLIAHARRRPWPAITLLTAGALAWNYWLMVQYTVGLVPKDAPVSFGALVRQQADVHTRPPYVYPFAFPANVWFAWREGVPADRYERLAFEPRRDTLDLPLTRDAAPFLLEGWEPMAADSSESLVWTRDRRATLVVPLALPAGRQAEIVLTARARLDDPPVNATVGVEVNGREVGRVIVPPATVADLRLPIGPEVGAIFRAGYNRLALVSHGVERVDAADERPPGPMARRLGGRPWPVAVHRIRIGVREP